MTFFWGDDLLDETPGLDILGVRGVDQAVEASLVNGITTISLRGRYLSLLPWALGEFFSMETAGGDVEFDNSRLLRFIRRVEFMTLAASRLDENDEAAGGALGSMLNADLVRVLLASEDVEFPTEKGGAMLGTYYGPCRAIGLLADGDPNSGPPFRLTPRGRAVWECRRQALEGSAAMAALRLGKPINRELAKTAIPHFSLGALAASGKEAKLVQEALLVPWIPTNDVGRDEVAAAYERFAGTLEWAKRMLTPSSDTAAGLLAKNYRSCVAGEVSDGTALAWAEYEYRRRCHFALELLLASFTGHLAVAGDSSVKEAVEAWTDSEPPGTGLREIWPAAAQVWNGTAADAKASISTDLFLGVSLPVVRLRTQRPADQALAAFAILSAIASQTEPLHRRGMLPHVGGAGDRAVETMQSAGPEQFALTMQNLLETCAIGPHLAATLRKMGSGQKCSLRFFPDGPTLRATGIGVFAGHSQDRLSNVLRILADVGALGWKGGGYTITSNGDMQ